MLQQAFRAGTRRLRGEQQAAPGADLAEAAEQRVAQLQLVAQAPLEGRFVQARQQAPGRLHRHLLRGQRTEQQQRRLAVHGQFAAMPSGPRRQRLQALAGSLAGHPSGIWHRGLHDQGVPARPPPVVDLRQRLAEYAGQGVQQLPDRQGSGAAAPLGGGQTLAARAPVGRRREEPGQGRAHGGLEAIARTEQAQRPVLAERLQAHLHTPQACLAAQRTQRLAQRQKA
ncbi:Uncharacterised protein [Klebsiella pneumoniae]|nr:Uncharacterised protein [Klebsiella pneumoniae]